MSVLCVTEEQSVWIWSSSSTITAFSGAPAVDADGRLPGRLGATSSGSSAAGRRVTVMHLMHTLMRQGGVSGADLKAPSARS